MSDGAAEVGLQQAASHEWVRVVSGIDFSTATVVQGMQPKRRPAGRTIKLVAFRLAWWANKDGSNLYPSIGLISTICEVDYQTAKVVMRVLREVGLIDPQGDGKDGRQLYRLTIPEDLLERVKYRSPDEIRAQSVAATPPSAWVRRKRRSGGDPTRETSDAPGGMSSDPEDGRVGCPPMGGWDAHPLPTSDLPGDKRTNQESPQVTTSPAPVDEQQIDLRSVRPEIAALRASVEAVKLAKEAAS